MRYSLTDIKGMLLINKHRLDDELEVQAEVAGHISEALASANSRMSACKEELDQVAAKVLLELRSGGEKLTAGEVTAEVEVDPTRVSKLREYLAAKKEAEQWSGAHDAWKQRGFALKGLGDLYVAQYFVVDSAGKDNGYSADRAVLSQSRRESSSRPTRRRLERD